MVQQYKDWRIKAESLGWGTDQTKHKDHDLAFVGATTVGEYLKEKCAWFYDFE